MSERVVVIDYGSGNLRSAEKALVRAARDGGLDCTVVVSDAPDALDGASRIVLPGVGAFADCMRGLAGVPGLAAALADNVLGRGKPFLGICVGMQLLADRGLEHGVARGLGWIGGEVVPIETGDPRLKVPHMGWNELAIGRAHPVLDGLGGEGMTHAYFVHSYRFSCRDPQVELATTVHGIPITAVIGRDNIVGTQFHPEKSQRTGLKLLENFIRWRP